MCDKNESELCVVEGVNVEVMFVVIYIVVFHVTVVIHYGIPFILLSQRFQIQFDGAGTGDSQ